jgi:hypothetical protein
MADLSITIANNVLFVGYSPTSEWGTLEWGTDWWRFNGESIQEVDKAVDFGSTTLSDAPFKDIEHLNDLGSTLLSDSIFRDHGHPISDSFELSSDMVTLYLTDANGYYTLFRGNVIDSDDRVNTSWSASAAISSPWTPTASTSTVWS